MKAKESELSMDSLGMCSSRSSVASLGDEKDLYHTQDSIETDKVSNKTVNPINCTESVSAANIDDENLKKKRLEQRRILMAYQKIPSLEITKLPRGGVSLETEAVGRVQFGIPPETIKDSMLLGLDVPLHYIVPEERFCREMGPALGVNLAEFEFPAYFNFFIQQKRCTLIVDSEEAENNIRQVFSETLLGPAQFRRKDNPLQYEEEDFAAEFPKEQIPNFAKELEHFRKMPDGSELVIETLLKFEHFHPSSFSKDTTASFGVSMHEDCCDDDFHGNISFNDEIADGMLSFYQRLNMYDTAVIYPPHATDEEKKQKTCKRVEILKSLGGSEYILHDINEQNVIIGKARFSGNVRVSASLVVHGFGTAAETTEESLLRRVSKTIPRNVNPPTFYPPSFGVTVLGNSHGFDASGSVSGYVLWINGRGVMIDPPPYSSATLEREGIRPRTIVGIILTHCHADHDAGAFQKVLTGSPVAVITTPTIYKSFIRKYAALSNLSPALLRHSHRHKPAIIGKPLRFQGATFHFNYTLHSIPTVGFRVEWRGRSIVFTGDHFNSPDGIDELQMKGVLSAERADSLKRLPMQETDLLLHEAGVPPLHTPLKVLEALPKRVKDHLYVVHTQQLPPGCDLRVAPTGTSGTIRLEEKDFSPTINSRAISLGQISECDDDDTVFQSMWTSNEYHVDDNQSSLNKINNFKGQSRLSIHSKSMRSNPPKVALRPTSSTDAWFILNLFSAVPFLTGLSYAHTMEVLETARVDFYSSGDIVVPATNRREVLCVVWEGKCIEKKRLDCDNNDEADPAEPAIWHAGDWTGPISLQPEERLSGESMSSKSHDIVAISDQGVKTITIDFSSLHTILKNGSALYRAYLELESKNVVVPEETPTNMIIMKETEGVKFIDVIEDNSTLRKVSAVEKRHFECLASGPKYFPPGENLWKSGTPADKAYIIVAGTASFITRRRRGGSSISMKKTSIDEKSPSFGEKMRIDADKVRSELTIDDSFDDESDNQSINDGTIQISAYDFNRQEQYDDYMKLSVGLQRRAEKLSERRLSGFRRPSNSTADQSDPSDSVHSLSSLIGSSQTYFEFDCGSGQCGKGRSKRRSTIDRLANKQLISLYNRRSYELKNLVFSRGHFLGDISKMMAGLLSSDCDNVRNFNERDDDIAAQLFDLTIPEADHDMSMIHDSTLSAGKDGCVVLEFSKHRLIPFFDEHPGLLLSLLGTNVVL